MPTNALSDPSFLARITWAHITLEFEVAGTARFPAFPGSTLRGALGHALRPALCQLKAEDACQPFCAQTCLRPASCPYSILFERSRDQAGRNIPKPLILETPAPPELENLAYTGLAQPPYEVFRHPNGTLCVRNEHEWHAGQGAAVRFELKFIGQTAALAVPLVRYLRAQALTVPGARLHLRRVEDNHAPGRVLWDARLAPTWPPLLDPPVTRSLDPVQCDWGAARLILRTPALLNVPGRFSAETLAPALLRQSVIRAMEIHDSLIRPGGPRLPFVDLAPEVRVAASRIYRYELPRISFRQDRWMNFDGAVGWLDVEGGLKELSPFLRAAEVLHVGQKAMFGLGAITVIPLER